MSDAIKRCCQQVAGAVRLARTELGLMVLDNNDPLVQARRKTCEACPKYEFGRCHECGCVLWGKTRVKNEKCPTGRWS